MKKDVPFLQMILSRDVSKLKVGRGFYTLSCTHSGGTFMDGILFKLSDNKFWFVQPDGDMNTWLIAHKDGFDVNDLLSFHIVSSAMTLTFIYSLF